MAAEHMVDVEVLTPEGEVFNGEVRQVSTRTAVGELGILANHAPLLASLQPTELRLHVSDSETKRYAQAHGWLQVFGNHAKLLVEEAIAPEELDAGDAQRAAGRRRAAPRGVRGGQRRAGAGREGPRPGRSVSRYCRRVRRVRSPSPGDRCAAGRRADSSCGLLSLRERGC